MEILAAKKYTATGIRISKENILSRSEKCIQELLCEKNVCKRIRQQNKQKFWASVT